MTSKKVRTLIGRILLVIFTTLLLLVLAVVGTVFVILRGPSRDAQELLTRSLKETSAIGFIPDLFLSSERVEEILRAGEEPAESGGATDARLVTISATKRTPSGQQGGAEAAAKEPGRMLSEGIWLVDITGPNYRGVLMIVEDPTRVFVGTPEHLGDSGSTLEEMVAYYDAIAGINAGGFNDEGGHGNGSTPQGLVIDDGEVTWGANHVGGFHVVGLDKDGILRVGFMTVQGALDAGIRWGVSFETHDGLASALIVNGEVQRQNLGSGVNPRTAIGQREDGALLLLVLDGRSISTLGATMKDLVDIMLEYGAVNAGNLDGGSSSVMVYGGEIINNCASVVGPRRIPTAFLLMEEGDVDG